VLGLSKDEDTVKLLSDALSAWRSFAFASKVFDLRRRFT
jgi:hypothetical protein